MFDTSIPLHCLVQLIDENLEAGLRAELLVQPIRPERLAFLAGDLEADGA
eukprot:CAMPEP_0204384272 /NCGR_PEP_ID=MMETSP0469-20131031/56727_1 /ASSEMBLY_ACC=CAM_ASM_000384 /TAXON_ID=2969 /ORGANISM="Oxyrrhis marina" /LENGTH=49 /DNA_ID= /DNA_START= /DNA_END= /DNA_ORIENTATION=